MKRRHRSFHLMIWLILAPAITAILYLAFTLRPAETVDNALPNILVEELG